MTSRFTIGVEEDSCDFHVLAESLSIFCQGALRLFEIPLLLQLFSVALFSESDWKKKSFAETFFQIPTQELVAELCV